MRATEKFLKEMHQYKGARRAEALLQEQELHPELRNRTIWVSGKTSGIKGGLTDEKTRTTLRRYATRYTTHAKRKTDKSEKNGFDWSGFMHIDRQRHCVYSKSSKFRRSRKKQISYSDSTIERTQV